MLRPISKVVVKFLRVMQKHGYINEFEIIDDQRAGKIVVDLNEYTLISFNHFFFSLRTKFRCGFAFAFTVIAYSRLHYVFFPNFPYSFRHLFERGDSC